MTFNEHRKRYSTSKDIQFKQTENKQRVTSTIKQLTE